MDPSLAQFEQFEWQGRDRFILYEGGSGPEKSLDREDHKDDRERMKQIFDRQHTGHIELRSHITDYVQLSGAIKQKFKVVGDQKITTQRAFDQA
jgi:hypothetical protein